MGNNMGGDMGDGLTTNDGDVIRTNQEADASSHVRGTQGQSSMSDGGARMPGETPAEVPADRPDPGEEAPMPDGDTVPAPDGPSVPDPSTPGEMPSPTPAPTEVPQIGSAEARPSLSSDEIASDVRANGGLGAVLGMEMGGGGTSSTEDAMARAADAQEKAGR